MKIKRPLSRPENVGKRLMLTRLALGFENKKEFYSATGLGASSYSMWEKGDSFPHVTHMMLLCQKFGLTLDWIYRAEMSALPFALATRIREIAKERNEEFGEAIVFNNTEIGA